MIPEKRKCVRKITHFTNKNSVAAVKSKHSIQVLLNLNT